MTTERAKLHLHLVSDSTGETLEMIAKAGLARFEGVEAIKHFWPMVRSEGHLDRVIEEITRKPGLIIYTLVDGGVRERLEQRCTSLGLPIVSPLDPTIGALSELLGQVATRRPGRQHIMDKAYFQRVDAINYTMVHDDGAAHDDWEEADIVLAGVSWTSKTPTSIYLANRGVKTANFPLVPGMPVPAKLEALAQPLVVGLTASPERIVQIRQNRLLGLRAEHDADDYVDRQAVAAEIAAARKLCGKHNWPIIDVTRRSIEETAAEVMALLADRRRQSAG